MLSQLLRILFLLEVLTTATCAIVPCNASEYLPFYCDDGTCVDRKTDYCNKEAECPDGSDELAHNSSNGKEGIECQSKLIKNFSCHLPKRYLCDHEVDCVDGQDECGCVHTFECDNGECGLKVQFCNGKTDCEDETDEIQYNRSTGIGFQCPVTRFHETNICVLPDRYICDGDSDCDNGIDECFCDFSSETGVYLNETYSNDQCFRCLDGSLIIPNKFVCDGVVHCPDLSDECLCRNDLHYTRPKICQSVCDGSDCICPGQTMCTAKNEFDSVEEICLPLESICDNKFDCANGFDEKLCPEENQYFNCYDNKTRIKKNLLCNGESNCNDTSDETHCKELTDYYCNSYRNRLSFVSDWENETQTNDPRVSIPLGRKLTAGYPFYANRCDGVPMCAELDDECHAPGCAEPRPGYCDFVERSGTAFRCNNSLSVILGREVCDGMPSCNDTNPELSGDELHCPNRFYCENRGSTRLPIHIPLSSQCDEIQDCDDQSDEMGCGNETHYYCNDTGSKKFIRRAQVCDGTLDCSNGQDECQKCNESPFSDDEKLITSRVLIVFLWIIGLIALFGNLAVVAIQIQELMNCKQNGGRVANCNRQLVLNLSVADLLVGIYLVSLGIKDASVPQYCTLDLEWRASIACKALGTIALIGTEVSVFTLLLMTGYRLYLVVSPFSTLKPRVVKISILSSWALALLIALIPHATSLNDYFVSCVWYRDNRFFGMICRADLEAFCNELLARSYISDKFLILRDGTTWGHMFEAVRQLNSTLVPERYFGYYSAHGVCLPRLFPDRRNDNSWGYSMFLIVLNFVSLVCIMIGYIQIYRISTRTTKLNKTNSKTRANDLQKKITRIVATDFCCWMPICIMAFVKVSGQNVSDTAYAVTAIILLPINAAINPFLYSNIIDLIWDLMMPIRKRFAGTPCGRSCVAEQSPKTRKSSIATAGANRTTAEHLSSSDDMNNKSMNQETKI